MGWTSDGRPATHVNVRRRGVFAGVTLRRWVCSSSPTFIGDGASGTLNISGGLFYTKDTKHVFLASLNDSQVNLSAGTLVLSRYGIEQGAAFGTFNMTGGTLDYYNLPSALNNGGPPVTLINNVNQINVDWVNYTGGNMGGLGGIG